MTSYELRDEYFEWIFDLVCGNRYSKPFSYRKLLMYLFDTEFRYSIPRDANRAEDGIALRYRFRSSSGKSVSMNRPCSVLEMMVALSIRCEENIMDDPNIGDRTSQWFWSMVNSLGLGSMSDDRFDINYVENAIERFLDRDYEPNGKGGLFTIRNCEYDLRTVEIWYQLCWYLDSIT